MADIYEQAADLAEQEEIPVPTKRRFTSDVDALSPLGETLRETVGKAVGSSVLLDLPNETIRALTGKPLVGTPSPTGAKAEDITQDIATGLGGLALDVWGMSRLGPPGFAGLGVRAARGIPAVTKPLTRPLATALTTGLRKGVEVGIKLGVPIGGLKGTEKGIEEGKGLLGTAKEAVLGAFKEGLAFAAFELPIAAVGSGLKVSAAKKLRTLIKKAPDALYSPEDAIRAFKDAGASPKEALLATYRLIALRQAKGGRTAQATLDAVQRQRAGIPGYDPYNPEFQARATVQAQPELPGLTVERGPNVRLPAMEEIPITARPAERLGPQRMPITEEVPFAAPTDVTNQQVTAITGGLRRSVAAKVSLADRVRELGGFRGQPPNVETLAQLGFVRKRGGLPAERLYAKLEKEGYDVGDTPNEMVFKITQDDAAKRAGSLAGRVYSAVDQEILHLTSPVETSARVSGLPPSSAIQTLRPEARNVPRETLAQKPEVPAETKVFEPTGELLNVVERGRRLQVGPEGVAETRNFKALEAAKKKAEKAGFSEWEIRAAEMTGRERGSVEAETPRYKPSMSEDLAKIHENKIRETGLETARSSSAKAYFRRIAALAAKTKNQEALTRVDSALKAYEDGHFPEATQNVEAAVTALHKQIGKLSLPKIPVKPAAVTRSEVSALQQIHEAYNRAFATGNFSGVTMDTLKAQHGARTINSLLKKGAIGEESTSADDLIYVPKTEVGAKIPPMKPESVGAAAAARTEPSEIEQFLARYESLKAQGKLDEAAMSVESIGRMRDELVRLGHDPHEATLIADRMYEGAIARGKDPIDTVADAVDDVVNRPRYGRTNIVREGDRVETYSSTDKDLHPMRVWFGSDIEVGRDFPEFNKVRIRREELHANETRQKMRFENEMTQKWGKRLSDVDKKTVMDALMEQKAGEKVLSDSELTARGITGEKRAFFNDVRPWLLEAYQGAAERGIAFGRDPHTYMPEVFEGDFRVRLLNEKGEPIQVLGRFPSEKKGIEFAKAYMDKNPKVGKVEVSKLFEIPADAELYMGPRQFKAWIKNLEKLYPGKNISKDEIVKLLASTDRELKAKFTPNFLPKRARPDFYVKDPLKALQMYWSSVQRKFYVEDFLRSYYEDVRGITTPYLKRYAEMYRDASIGKIGMLDSYVQNGLARTFGLSPRQAQKLLRMAHTSMSWAKLGYQPFSPIVNLTQTLTATYPVLGAKYTARGVREGLAMKFGQTSKNVEILKELGLDLHMDLSGKGIEGLGIGIKKAKLWHPLWMFQKSEAANRIVAGLGAYYRGIERMGFDHLAAIRYARDVVARTQFTGLRIPLLRGQTANLFGQFKGFVTSYMNFVYGMRHNPAEMLRWLTMTSALVGPAGLPLIGESNKVKELKAKYPAMRGLPGMAGLDVSRSVGYSDFVPLEAKQVLGPWGQVGIQAFQTAGDPTKANKELLLRSISPTVVNRARQAGLLHKMTGLGEPGELETGQMKSASGQLISPISKGEAWTRLIGPQPERTARLRDATELGREMEKDYSNRRQKVLDRIFDGDKVTKEDLALFGTSRSLKASIKAEWLSRNYPQVFRDLKGMPLAARIEQLELLREAGLIQ